MGVTVNLLKLLLFENTLKLKKIIKIFQLEYRFRVSISIRVSFLYKIVSPSIAVIYYFVPSIIVPKIC